MTRTLVIDHRDSFAFLLAEQLQRHGADVDVVRSDLALDELRTHLAHLDPDLVVLSPGPGHPTRAGVTPSWLATRPNVPVFGVCLGHQALAIAAGGAVGRGPEPVHGKAWPVQLRPDPLFEGLPRVLSAARYHSLVVTHVPAALEVLATARDGDHELVMAARHRERPWLGVQFHPESCLTPHGGPLLERVLAWARRERTKNPKTNTKTETVES